MVRHDIRQWCQWHRETVTQSHILFWECMAFPEAQIGFWSRLDWLCLSMLTLGSPWEGIHFYSLNGMKMYISYQVLCLTGLIWPTIWECVCVFLHVHLTEFTATLIPQSQSEMTACLPSSTGCMWYAKCFIKLQLHTAVILKDSPCGALDFHSAVTLNKKEAKVMEGYTFITIQWFL